MTREEQKATAANKFYHNNIECYDAFLHGVEWADKHPKDVWHHATEEPEFVEMLIVYLDKDGFIDIFNWTELKELCGDSWDNYVSYNDLVMWAYVDDFMSPNIRKQYINNE